MTSPLLDGSTKQYAPFSLLTLGSDQSQAQFSRSNSKVLGAARMHPEDSSRGEEDPRPVPAQQGTFVSPGRTRPRSVQNTPVPC